MLKKLDNIQGFYHYFLLSILVFAVLILGASAIYGDSSDLIVSDGNGYYAWIRSIFIDGDINFENDFKLLYFPDSPPPELLQRTPKGLIPNKYPVGMAILEIPGFFLGHLIAQITPFAEDGLSLPYQISVTFSLIIFILFSFFLLYLAFINFGVEPKIGLIFCVLFLLGTNLLHYLVKEPTMAHGAGVALTNVLIYLASLSKHKFNSLAIGFLFGLLVLVRNTNFLLLPFFLVLFWQKIKRKTIITLTLGTGLTILLQPIALFFLWGKPLLNSYQGKQLTGQVSGIFATAFGEAYGVFLYHPWYLILVILNLLGWLVLKHKRIFYLTIIIVVLSLLITNGLWDYSGDSFGNRAFIETLSPLSLGAALVCHNFCYKISRYVQLSGLILAGILVMANIYLWGGYLLNKYPHNHSRTIADVYLWLL